jgi:hypothetical protein
MRMLGWSDDFKKLGFSKILIWSLDITYQKSKKSIHANQEPKFSSFCMNYEQTGSLKTSNKLSFNSVG